MQNIWRFVRGATIVLPLFVDSGDGSAIEPLAAHLRPLRDGEVRPRGQAPSAGTFEISFQAAAEGEDAPDRFYLVLDDVRSLSVPAGRYAVDMRFRVGGSIEVTEPLIVHILEPVTIP